MSGDTMPGDTRVTFGQRTSTHDVERGAVLAPKFDGDGLIPAVATDHRTGEVLMVAYMNRAALAATIDTGQAHYWSRSRQELWHKGATSGQVQHIVELRIDCDQDAVWLKVDQQGGGACHVGYRSCFYRSVDTQKARDGDAAALKLDEDTA